jgi:DNA-binding beta-propeller fold protein YncE
MRRPWKSAPGFLAPAVLAVVALLAFAATAAARTVPTYTYTGEYYDGTGSTAGPMSVGRDVAVNQENGRVYVVDPGTLGGSISQFDAEGNPLPFSALAGATAIPYLMQEGNPRIAVDNSSRATQGNIYVVVRGDLNSVIKGWQPDGTKIGDDFPFGGLRAACGLAVDAEGDIWALDYSRSALVEVSPTGAPTGVTIAITPFTGPLQNGECDLAIDAEDNFYVTAAGPEIDYVKKFDSEGNYLYDLAAGSNSYFTGDAPYVASLGVDVDLSTGHVFLLQPTPFQPYYSTVYNNEVYEFDQNGEAITAFGAPDPAHSFLGLNGPSSVAVAPSGQKIYVANNRQYAGVERVEIFAPSGQALVPTTKTELPGLTPTGATLKGTVDLDGGGDATSCYFEWGPEFVHFEGQAAVYGQTAACAPGAPVSGAGVHQVTAQLGGLTQGAKYHYRLVTKNANGVLAFGHDRGFRPQGAVSLSPTVVSEVNTDGARFTSQINPNGGETSYFVEYGPEDCDLSTCTRNPIPVPVLPKVLGTQTASVVLSGLGSDTAYHYRLVGENANGPIYGDEDVFRTYAPNDTNDQCENALVRKETLGVLLPDCRAYELVSAADTGGYDVRSNLIPGQVPLTAKPRAADRLLYSMSFGKIPGVAGEPTNHQLDPYVAARTPAGWSTHYAGIAVGTPPSQLPFASTPIEESEDLSTLVFGGGDLCEPCFGDGKRGLPFRRDEGPLSQGMAGAVDPGPTAAPDGYVSRMLSADGTHLVFGSTAVFESDAAGTGDVSIYDRNLATGVTHVVSKTPGGTNLPCLQGVGACHSPGDGDGIAALDVSDDGSRIVVAQRVGTDAAGNDHWHPYMNVGDSQSTVDLAPGANTGVVYVGMTGDGSSVFYTTVDALTSDDHDASADLFRAEVSPGGSVDVTRVSTGAGAGDTNACDPVPGDAGNNWNAVGAASQNGCGVVGFAGGAGVARGSGAVYFLSPESLDGEGSANQPNLYVSSRGGSPHFVTTLEPANGAITDAVENSEKRTYGDIQVTPSGTFAVFSSRADLTGFPTFGHEAIYRYSTVGDSLACASCPTTRASLTADTALSAMGLNLSDDGRVFFTSLEPLALRDSGVATDVYEWEGGKVALITTGRSATDARLLSASANGVDAFFFTRDRLVSMDRNGGAIKVYTAREDGGFLAPVVRQPCQASDECHGPGSVAPLAGGLPTLQGNGGNLAQPQPKRKKHHKKRKRHRKHQHRGHAGNSAGSGR